ncbi:MAG: hypothetical protein U0X75_25065 [Acidobacteriota bacterium]
MFKELFAEHTRGIGALRFGVEHQIHNIVTVEIALNAEHGFVAVIVPLGRQRTIWRHRRD